VLIVLGTIVLYALAFRTRAGMAPPAVATSGAIRQAADALSLARSQSSARAARAVAAPMTVTSAATSALPVASRPEIRPSRKAKTKASKDNAIYRRD
jgi:hypothetical protein